ncbi:Presenilin [Aphelenchoides besseyi]|nr:Presenilin [Aphelenchoides besseyi]
MRSNMDDRNRYSTGSMGMKRGSQRRDDEPNLKRSRSENAVDSYDDSRRSDDRFTNDKLVGTETFSRIQQIENQGKLIISLMEHQMENQGKMMSRMEHQMENQGKMMSRMEHQMENQGKLMSRMEQQMENQMENQGKMILLMEHQMENQRKRMSLMEHQIETQQKLAEQSAVMIQEQGNRRRTSVVACCGVKINRNVWFSLFALILSPLLFLLSFPYENSGYHYALKTASIGCFFLAIICLFLPTIVKWLEQSEFSLQTTFFASPVIQLIVPVSLCMLLVIVAMQTIGYFSRDDGVYLIYTPFIKPTDGASELFLMTLGNVLILLVVVIVSSLALIGLYQFHFYKVISGSLIMSSVVILGMINAIYIEQLMKNYNQTLDLLTYLFLVWNLAILGMICVHWKAPQRLQQAYLVMMCALMALVFIKHLPEWTVWAVLVVLAIWDLVAVLCPNDSLRVLVETAQERNKPIFPTQTYSTTVSYTRTMAPIALDDPNEHAAAQSTSTRASEVEHEDAAVQIQALSSPELSIASPSGHNNTADNFENGDRHRAVNSNVLSAYQPDDEDRGIKFRLGGFIFYALLVGKASSCGDWNTTIACYIAILLGLNVTLLLLALFRKALPALTISIFFGLIFYFTTSGVITPFILKVSEKLYLI